MDSVNGRRADNGEGIVLSESDVEAAIAITPYPAEKYRAAREGRMSTREYIDDLIEHVRADMARRARTAR